MNDILTAPWMVEMIRTATNMYNHGWDERNGGNISLLLDEEQVSEYLNVKNVIRTMDTGFAAPTLPWLCPYYPPWRQDYLSARRISQRD